MSRATRFQSDAYLVLLPHVYASRLLLFLFVHFEILKKLPAPAPAPDSIL